MAGERWLLGLMGRVGNTALHEQSRAAREARTVGGEADGREWEGVCVCRRNVGEGGIAGQCVSKWESGKKNSQHQSRR